MKRQLDCSESMFILMKTYIYVDIRAKSDIQYNDLVQYMTKQVPQLYMRFTHEGDKSYVALQDAPLSNVFYHNEEGLDAAIDVVSAPLLYPYKDHSNAAELHLFARRKQVIFAASHIVIDGRWIFYLSDMFRQGKAIPWVLPNSSNGVLREQAE